MTQKPINKRIHKVMTILIILLLLVTTLSCTLLTVINKNNNEIEIISNQIHLNWSNDINMYLNLTRTKMELAINNKELDPTNNTEIKEWLTKNMHLMDIQGINHMDNISVICIGYSQNVDFSNLKNILEEENIYTDKLFNEINAALLNISNSYDELDSKKILSKIAESSSTIANNNNLEYDTIKNIFIELLVEDNSIIISSDNISINELLDENSYKLKISENNSMWVESIVIPEGVLGFNNEEPYTKNNEKNLKYKKIAINISANSEDVINDYNPYIKNYYNIVNISLGLLTFIIIASMILIIVSFHNMLKLNQLCGDEDEVRCNENS